VLGQVSDGLGGSVQRIMLRSRGECCRGDAALQRPNLYRPNFYRPNLYRPNLYRHGASSL